MENRDGTFTKDRLRGEIFSKDRGINKRNRKRGLRKRKEEPTELFGNKLLKYTGIDKTNI